MNDVCPTCGSHKSYHAITHHCDGMSSHDHKCNCDHNCRQNSHSCCDCCHSHHHHCRRSICDEDFSIRLGGLQNGLNFRLRQLIGCKVEFLMDNGNTLYGEIRHVGSNFVEIMEEDYKRPKIVKDKVIEEVSSDDEMIEKPPSDIKKKKNKRKKKNNRKKKHMTIFSMDKIMDMKYRCSCH